MAFAWHQTIALSAESGLEEPLWILCFFAIYETDKSVRNMNHQVVLLLTGCVQPNIKNDVLAIKDVETRKNQYLEAIDWYIKNTPYKIVFCENSGYDLKSEMAIRGGAN